MSTAAEAEATPLPDQPAASHEEGVQRALQLLRLADALGKANDLKTPRALHVRRARYLTLLKEENAAREAQRLADQTEASTAPDLFLNCQQRLGVLVDDCYVVGDAVWDLLAARRARMLSIGLLSGGYGEDQLTRAGAFRVYRDAAELHSSLDELGILP